MFVYLLVCVVIVINPCVSGGFVISASVCMSVCDLSIVYLVLQTGTVLRSPEAGPGSDEADV